MEDALISPESFMILSGAGLIEASATGEKIYQHMTETANKAAVHFASGVDTDTESYVLVKEKPFIPTATDPGYGENMMYVMLVKDGEIVSEPFIPAHNAQPTADAATGAYKVLIAANVGNGTDYTGAYAFDKTIEFDSAIIDYYVARESGAKQIEITADKFGGNYYLEASTLFRNEAGVDLPAEFIIPNCKVQSNFTFTMAASGDPSKDYCSAA